MIEIKGDNFFINVNANTVWDANMNNYAGGNKLEVQIDPGPDLITMQANIATLQGQVMDILNQQMADARLRDENPALKDIHDKYQIVYELVKKADNATGNDGGG